MINFLLSERNVLDTILILLILAFSQYIALKGGVFSFATAGFAALGGYLSGYLSLRLDVGPVVSIGAGVALATIIGVLLGLVCFQLRGVFLAIATLAFVLGLQSLVYLFSGVTGGGVGLLPITPWSETHVLLIATILVAALMAWIDFSPFGKALDSIKSDEVAAASIGLPTDALRVAVFAISGLIGGLGGALLAHHNYAIFPSDFSFSLIVAVLTYVVIGGSGSWWGPAIGTVILVALPEVLRPLQTYRPIFHGLVLVIAVLFMPRGAVGLARQAFQQRRLRQAGARG